MPIIITVLAALAAAAHWNFRMRAVADMANEVIDAAQRIRGAHRRRRFRSKAERAHVTSIEDPAAAAVAMLIALASLRGPLSPTAAAAIKEEMRRVMGLQNPDETFIFARWVANQASDPDDLSRHFSRLWLGKLNPAE